MPDQVQACLSEAILAEIPHLRAYALLMTNDVSSANREVTETLKRALSNIDAFRKCKGLRVQLLTVLRNSLVESERALREFGRQAIYERLKGPFRIANGRREERPFSLASALHRLDFEDREAVVLQAGVRLSREDAAKIIGCAPNVYDARVRCGFARLAELLPAEAPAASAGGAISSRAFSGVSKALELQEMIASAVFAHSS